MSKIKYQNYKCNWIKMNYYWKMNNQLMRQLVKNIPYGLINQKRLNCKFNKIYKMLLKNWISKMNNLKNQLISYKSNKMFYVVISNFKNLANFTDSNKRKLLLEYSLFSNIFKNIMIFIYNWYRIVFFH